MKVFSRCGAIFLICCLMVALLPLPASAGTYDIFTYEIEDNKVTITGCENDTTGKVVVPDTIEGCPVAAIGEKAFQNQKNITEIVLPDTVQTIGQSAFSSCRELTGIQLPSALTSIEQNIFSSCVKLTSLHIPASVSTIDSRAFGSCFKLSSLTVENGNPYFYSVNNCVIRRSDKTLVVATANSQIPADGSVTTIAYGAFYSMTDLTTLTIPHGVTTVKGYAIMYCRNLVSLHLSATVTSFVAQTDANRKLASLTVDQNNPVYHSAGNCIIETDTKILIQGCSTSIIPTDGSVTTIGNRSFYQGGITTLTIPEGVTTIEYTSFFGANLTSVSLPNTLETVGSRAFYDTQLAKITFPGSVQLIGSDCLGSCDKLEAVTILNPNVQIQGDGDTLYGDITIYGYTGSTAEAYAKEYGKTFVALDAHTCTYDQQLTTDIYLSSPASCTAPAKYFYSCTCGEKGTKTFTHGNALPHTYDNNCDTSCNVCKAGRTVSHSYADTWKADKSDHWRECACGAKTGEAAHTWDSGTTTDAGTVIYKCATCGAQRTEDIAPVPDITEPTVPTEPVQTEPVSTDPAPTAPTQTTPVSTNPAPIAPTQTTPVSTDPAPTQPPVSEQEAPSLLWLLPAFIVILLLLLLILFLLKRKKEKE